MKKRLAVFLAAAMAVSVMGGCSGGTTSGTANTGAVSEAAAGSETGSGSPQGEEAKIKDTIKIALAYDITSLDPHIGKEMRACIISQQIFDTLVEWDPAGGIGSEIVPCLATSWEYLSDTAVQFKLR